MSVENPLALDHPHFPGYNTHKASIFSIQFGVFSPISCYSALCLPANLWQCQNKGSRCGSGTWLTDTTRNTPFENFSIHFKRSCSLPSIGNFQDYFNCLSKLLQAGTEERNTFALCSKSGSRSQVGYLSPLMESPRGHTCLGELESENVPAPWIVSEFGMSCWNSSTRSILGTQKIGQDHGTLDPACSTERALEQP